MHDGECTSNTTVLALTRRVVRELLDQEFGMQLIDRNAPRLWRPRLPDLTLLTSFFGVILTSKSSI